MPELPEVETVRRGLNTQFSELKPQERKLLDLGRSRKQLRFKFPVSLVKALSGRNLVSVERRAKYLLFDFEDKILINHLGMTGSWRKSDATALSLHEHVALSFRDDFHLIYRDPRRFGYFDLLNKNDWMKSAWFAHLGPEPLISSDFNSDYLFEKTRKRAAPIKSFIMDQKTVVGVGNIYASEALFTSKISPLREARSLDLKECKTLVHSIQKILAKSIEEGGSTIRDFVSAEGESGYFSKLFKVYDREGEACKTCRGKIQQVRMAGRSTYWCPQCQK